MAPQFKTDKTVTAGSYAVHFLLSPLQTLRVQIAEVEIRVRRAIHVPHACEAKVGGKRDETGGKHRPTG